MPKKQITVDANGIPDRVDVGVNNRTIPFPHEDYLGLPDDFPFTGIMASHWRVMRDALTRNCYDVKLFGASKVIEFRKGELGKGSRVEFVLVAETPDGKRFVWQKYESAAQGSGQNNVFVGGQMMKMTRFNGITEDQRDELLEPVELRRILRQQGLV